MPKDMPAPSGCTQFKLKQAARVVSRHYDGFVLPTGLKITQYSLLASICAQGPVRLGELATGMHLDASTLSRNLQPLLDRGLAQVQPGADARSREVQATPAGLALRSQAQRAWKRAQLTLNQRLGAARVQDLHRLLDECLQILQTPEP